MALNCGNDYLQNLMENMLKLDYLCDVKLVAGLDGEK